MSRLGRSIAITVAAALGVGGAVALAAGDHGVGACANKRSGVIRATTAGGKCTKADVSITISGQAFNRGPRQTVSLDGIVLKGSDEERTITINGTSFHSGAAGTITINGASFGPGTAAKAGPTGPAGPKGDAGADGKPGAPGPATPSETAAHADAVSACGGCDAPMESLSFTSRDGKPHRVLVTGGFDETCTTCPDKRITPKWSLQFEGGGTGPHGSTPIANGESAGVTVDELLTMPGVCNPCTITLSLSVPAGDSGAPPVSVDGRNRRLGLVDLGPVDQ